MIEYTIRLPDNQGKTLAHNHEDPEAFLQEICDQVACREENNLISSRGRELRDDPAVETMPASDDGILNALWVSDGYLDAKGRVAASKAERDRQAT